MNNFPESSFLHYRLLLFFSLVIIGEEGVAMGGEIFISLICKSSGNRKKLPISIQTFEKIKNITIESKRIS